MFYSVLGTLSSMIALKYIDIYWGGGGEGGAKEKKTQNLNQIKTIKKTSPHLNLPVSPKSGYNSNFLYSVYSSKPFKMHFVTFDCFLHFTTGPFWNNYVNKKIYYVIPSYYATWSCLQSHAKSKRISTNEHLYMSFEICAWLPKLKE